MLSTQAGRDDLGLTLTLTLTFTLTLTLTLTLTPTLTQAGRDDLVRAARELCEEGMRSPQPRTAVDEAAVGRQLQAHAGWPDPVSLG